MQKTILKTSITLVGPIITQSSSPENWGIDMVTARTDGNPYIPGTLLTGKLRQSLEQLSGLNNTNDSKAKWFKPKLDLWLGKATEIDGLSASKLIYISDFIIDDESLGRTNLSTVRNRIVKEQATGAAKPGHILMMENMFNTNEEYKFKGEIHFFSPEGDAEGITKHIKTGFNWFTKVGGLKSIGYGRVQEVNFDGVVQNPIAEQGIGTQSNTFEKLSISINPTFPFCVSDSLISDNLFESSSIITGGGILGCIATTWNQLLGERGGLIGSGKDDNNQFEDLKANFNKIRISHAFPAEGDKKQRPVVAPLSLTQVRKSSDFYDVANLEIPSLINNKVPSFAVDWKADRETLKGYPWPYLRMKSWGWASLQSELRIRTKIDRETGMSSDQELFAYQQIKPKDTKWYAEIDLSRVEDEGVREKVAKQLSTLVSQGISNFSKTKSPATITFENAVQPSVPSVVENVNNQWVLTLQTDALIGSPEGLSEASGKDELQKMYEKAWDELSDGKIKLIRYFARQKIAGGEHKHKVFQKDSNVYKPWLLTEAGSVFVLKASTQSPEGVKDAQQLIERHFNQGLPITKTTCRFYGIAEDTSEQWRNCPFIPQNGYGEVAVNLQMPSEVITLSNASKELSVGTISSGQEQILKEVN